jgi:hypothetical protein
MTSVALERRLRAGEFVITAEITPPLSADPQDLLDMALPLRRSWIARAWIRCCN